MSVYSDLILAEASLVSYWRLDEPSGTLNDSKGVNDLSAVSSPTFGVDGLLASDPTNDAIDLERSLNQRLTCADHASLDLGDIVTTEAWIKLESLGNFQAIIAKGSGAYYMRVSSGNRLAFLRDQITNIVESTITLSSGAVYYVVATKNGSTVKLYVNGVDVTGTVTNDTLVNNGSALEIGRDLLNDTECFDGVIDEVALYSTALSAQAILDHYNAGAFSGGPLFLMGSSSY